MRTSENHHGELLLSQRLQRAFAGIDRHGVETLRLEKSVQQAALPGIVIDDEDPWRRAVFFRNIRWHGQNSSMSPAFP